MKNNGDRRALEKYKIFPFIAWGLVIGFTYFVYTITVDLQEAVSDLGVQTELLKDAVDNSTGKLSNPDS